MVDLDTKALFSAPGITGVQKHLRFPQALCNSGQLSSVLETSPVCIQSEEQVSHPSSCSCHAADVPCRRQVAETHTVLWE